MMIWHAVQYSTGRVAELEHRLFVDGVEFFAPLRWNRVKVGQKKYWQAEPWLGTYAFVRLDHGNGDTYLKEQMSLVLNTRGITDILMDELQVPYRVSDRDIYSLKSAVLEYRRDQDLPPSRRRLSDTPDADTPVRIVRGSFEGCTGRYCWPEGHGYAAIRISMFGRETVIKMADCDFVIEPAKKERAA